MYMAVVPRPMPAAVASDACGHSFAVLSTQASTVDLSLRRFSAKSDACGRSFAVLWTQVSTVVLRLG
jgi:hypothetical protein